MEALKAEGRTRLIGVSNVTLAQLSALCRQAKTLPAFVQNRCYARTGWDRGVRTFCRDHDIVYQGFSLLTANQRDLTVAPVRALARSKGVTVSQLVFAFARAVGMLALTGTSDPAHMQQDLAGADLTLEPEEVATVEGIAGFL
jgi:diketogulonate reductase-like aldo/keto reductase